MKTVMPPMRGSGGPHPAEVNEHLGLAYQLCNRLIEAAEKRGDQAGADAWLVARNAIESAEKEMQQARKKQTWRTVQGERVGALAARARADSDPLGRTAAREEERRKQDAQRPPYNVDCPTCGAPIGYPCQFSPADLHAPNEMVHVARSNQIGLDGKPRCAAWAYPHHPSWEPELQKPGGQRCVLGTELWWDLWIAMWEIIAWAESWSESQAKLSTNNQLRAELRELREAAQALSDAATHCRLCRDCGDGPCCENCVAEFRSADLDRLLNRGT